MVNAICDLKPIKFIQMKDKANKLFDDAVEKLNVAREELFRPEEDLVCFSVCKNSQYAIESFLMGYLLQNGIDPSSYKTIDSLYEECKTINKKFEEIDLCDFECKYHNIDSRYCIDGSKVSSCFNAADSLNTFLRQEKIINYIIS